MIFNNWRTSSYPIGLANLLHNFYFNNVIFHNYIFLLLTQKGACFLSFPLVKVKSGCLCLSISATQLHQLTTSLFTCVLCNICLFFFFFHLLSLYLLHPWNIFIFANTGKTWKRRLQVTNRF